jgi:hypothetical protein
VVHVLQPQEVQVTRSILAVKQVTIFACCIIVVGTIKIVGFF